MTSNFCRSAPLGGGEDRGDDQLVARAAADVAGDRPHDVLAGRLGVLGQQRLGDHDHARGAEPALGGEVLEERLLDLVELAARPGDALERPHRGAVDRLDRDQARHHRLAVDQAGAGAARPLGAAALGRRDADRLAQRGQQRAAGGGEELLGLVVDDELDDTGSHGSPLSHSPSSARRTCTGRTRSRYQALA
jgi:hypothetical protein